MREIRRLAWAAAIAAAFASPVFAQIGGGTTTGGAGTTTGLGGGTGGIGGGTGGAGGAGGAGSQSGQLQGSIGGTSLATMQKAPSLIAPSQVNTSTNTAIKSSNFLRNYYGAVYFQGSNPNNVPNALPGNFGTPLYPATGATGGGAGAAGGLGGGRAGLGSSAGVNTSDPGGILVPLPRQIAYAAQVQFKTPPTAPTVLQADLRGLIDRSSIASPAGVQIRIDGRDVTLRGTVRDQDEARTIEGMVRLTPGVGLIKNELTFPK